MLTKELLDSLKYLLGLNITPSAERETWLPWIESPRLNRLIESNSTIVMANDWFSQGSYCHGAYYLDGDGIIPLQNKADTRIVNAGDDFIFELGNSDHKGLIAIEIQEGTEFFVLRESDNEKGVWKKDLFFEPGTSDKFVDKVISIVKSEDIILNIHMDQHLMVTAKDYQDLVATLPIVLI